MPELVSLVSKFPGIQADLQWDRLANLGPSGPEAETLPLSQRGLGLVSVILTSHFEETGGLFWDGLRNFEPWSGDEDDT
ncbi:hypothetical protein AVEN_118010-1 [Araneus ventricosus]|uniref:Uncharacterized protein n=1 Tax=Araneus ventricosus TaxID=182803 RepID=A0A4Y2C8I5_ARAVE|nr:hypothetical protein AVEN_118010-1 [Araneus ventricosus]